MQKQNVLNHPDILTLRKFVMCLMDVLDVNSFASTTVAQ